jgi:hypothetical protein
MQRRCAFAALQHGRERPMPQKATNAKRCVPFRQ